MRTLLPAKVLTIAAIVCQLVLAFTPVSEPWRPFLNGMCAGMLLGVVFVLFRLER